MNNSTVDAAQESPVLKLVDTEDNRDTVSTAPAHEEQIDGTFLVSKRISVRIDSLGVLMLDSLSLIRVFRREFATKVAYFQSEEGGTHTLEEAIEKATHQFDESERAKVFERLLTTAKESISFRDLHELWTQSPEDAEYIWQEMRHAARQELITGYIATAVFEGVDWMRSAWKRALFLGIRDSFIDEYEPEGGVEIALVDMMSQAHFLYQHWTEEAIRRTKTDPRRFNDECRNGDWYKHQTGSEMWEPGNWEIPYATELQAQEQALKYADQFSRLFNRAVRQLNNHRLAKARFRRLALPRVRKDLVECEHENAKEYLRQLGKVRASTG